MAQGQLIATLDCITQEIILDVQGGTASGNFKVMFPDATTQTLSGTLPLTVTSIFSGTHVFYNTSLDSSSSVTSLLPISLDVDYINCSEIEDMSYCLFNLNNAYEKALCKNKKLAEIEKQKLDRAIQLVLLMEHLTECSENQTGCNVYGCTDSTAFNYNPNACMSDGSCIAAALGCTDSNAINYNASANTDDGSCCYISGCTDPLATNYNASACDDDGSCTYSSPCGNSTPCVPDTTGACTGTVSIPNANLEMAFAFMTPTLDNNGNLYNNLINASDACVRTGLNLNKSHVNTITAGYASNGGNIGNFTGLEAFVSLTYLSVAGHNINTFTSNNSLSFAPCLSEFSCASSNIDVSTLDFSQNSELENINCNGCTQNSGALPLSSTNNPKLKVLRVGDLGIGSYTNNAYDFSGWPCLTKIQFMSNDITSFDFTGLTSLAHLDVSSNPMTTIDVSMCTSLYFIRIQNCPNITDIYLGQDIDLNVLYTGCNPQGMSSCLSTNGSNAAVKIHVGTQARVNQANSLWPYIVGTFEQ
jgi:hypothetical protein